MIERRKRWFFRLLAMLRTLEADKADLTVLKELNGRLIARIATEERFVRRARERLKRTTERLKTQRLPKQNAQALRAEIASLREAIDGYFGHLFIWRSIGDAIVYLYLDKFSIKHAYFETGSLGVKPGAGFLSGKDGFLLEVGMMLDAIDHDVPSILCDITNVLRHGDVCLLGGSDPTLLEVKKGKKLNQRGKRQAAKLAKLDEFLETDTAPDFRGFRGVQRVSIGVEPRDNVAALNACISEACSSGYALSEPEEGIRYAVVSDFATPTEPLFANLNSGHILGVDFNENKNNREWAPYVPFILTLRDPDHLFRFICGTLYIMVFVDTEVLCAKIAPAGWIAKLIDHEGYLIEVRQTEGEGLGRISRQFVLRLAFECASLSWLVELEHQHLDSLVRIMTSTTVPEDVDPTYVRVRDHLMKSGPANNEDARPGADGIG